MQHMHCDLAQHRSCEVCVQQCALLTRADHSLVWHFWAQVNSCDQQFAICRHHLSNLQKQMPSKSSALRVEHRHYLRGRDHEQARFLDRLRERILLREAEEQERAQAAGDAAGGEGGAAGGEGGAAGGESSARRAMREIITALDGGDGSRALTAAREHFGMSAHRSSYQMQFMAVPHGSEHHDHIDSQANSGRVLSMVRVTHPQGLPLRHSSLLFRLHAIAHFLNCKVAGCLHLRTMSMCSVPQGTKSKVS